MSALDLAVIGGTGLYDFPGLEKVERRSLDTPFGAPSDAITLGELGGRRVAFLARHASGHSIPPHRINFRANVWALHSLGARRIVGVNAVGGIRADMEPRVLAVPDQ
ncbi:MAG: MTAP family purine nucleoside phosphorylase, partial [Rudaea sp.]